ncbi:MAG: alpha-amylase family glycosyl hydrolase [Bacteroidota bacterium]|nr:alpha-amylase family glycosyl hydrolase [Bacteroidota bacterium]
MNLHPNKQQEDLFFHDDPVLKPYSSVIRARKERYLNALDEINSEYGSLLSFAQLHTYLGFHYDRQNLGWIYREWAPNAKALYLIGDFNNWNRRSHPMRLNAKGYWEIFLADLDYATTFTHGSKVKVTVIARNGEFDRIPLFIRRVVQNEQNKDFSGQVWFDRDFDWGDDATFTPSTPLLIYEAHVGMAQETPGTGSYNDFTHNVLPRIKADGYTAIQLMAIQEHPYYGSFGYHVSNFFAASSRFGTPEDLKLLIKTAHSLGLLVIMDIVHSHSVKNINEGINCFDGTVEQFFHAGDRGNHPYWDSKVFDYGKLNVQRFLLSNISFWLDEFHFDGFRFDGIGSMLYKHHAYTEFDSIVKYFDKTVDNEAIEYLQLANTLVHQIKPSTITIAEDVSGMPGLTGPAEQGGLGFNYRLGMGIPDFWIKLLKESKDEDWNMQFIWSTLNQRIPGVPTISYAESHDQALVGDKTLAFRLMDKSMYTRMMKSDHDIIIDRGIALHKMIRLLTLAVGGNAYLNFMGNEFGHPEWIDFPREGNNWSYQYARRQWSLSDNPDLKYEFLLRFDNSMIKLCTEKHLLDYEFSKLLNLDEQNKTLVFERDHFIFVFNFHISNSIPGYEFPVTEMGDYRIVLNSDDLRFGGFGRIDPAVSYLSHYSMDKDQYMLSVYNINRAVLVFQKI